MREYIRHGHYNLYVVVVVVVGGNVLDIAVVSGDLFGSSVVVAVVIADIGLSILVTSGCGNEVIVVPANNAGAIVNGSKMYVGPWLR